MQTMPDFDRAGRALQTAPPVAITIDAIAAMQLVALMQLALRNPSISPALVESGTDIVKQIGDSLSEIDPEVKALVDAGWSEANDVDQAEFDAAIAGDFNIVEIHNPYTLYELNEDGTQADQPLLDFFRPQDWGDPKRWHYAECEMRFDIPGPDQLTTRYVHHCHVWREVESHPIAMFTDIAPQLFMVMQPGQLKEECDRSHLKPSDFWDTEWGEMPPYYEPEYLEEF